MQTRLLRLAALGGDSKLLSVLDGYKKSSPALAYYFIALLGSKQCVPVILQGLKQANHIEAAEKAWNLLTGVELPQVKRMFLASDSDRGYEKTSDDDDYDDEIFELDEEFDQDEDDEEDNMIPDASAAQDWWNANQDLWQTQQRYLAGQKANDNILVQLATDATGTIGRDLLDIVSLQTKKPFGDWGDTWVERRRLALAGITQGIETDDPRNTGSQAGSHQASISSMPDRTTSTQGRPYARAR